MVSSHLCAAVVSLASVKLLMSVIGAAVRHEAQLLHFSCRRLFPDEVEVVEEEAVWQADWSSDESDRDAGMPLDCLPK